MLSVIGWLLIVASVIFSALKFATKNGPFDKMKYKVLALAFVGGILFNFGDSMFFNARFGHQYFVVDPFGNTSVVINPGLKFIVPGSTVQEWEQVIDVMTADSTTDTRGVDGIIRGDIPVRFTDQVTANVSVSARFKIPEDPEAFKELAIAFRHPMNLINNTLIPTVREQVFNVAQMYKAEGYVSGGAQEFRATLDDALKDGTFVVDRREYQDTIYNNINVTDKEVPQRQIKEIITRVSVKKRTRSGVPVREEHDITKNGIIVEQVLVGHVNMNPKFKKKLEQQRDLAAEKSIEAQRTENAKIAQQRIISEGERDKAAERVKQEKEAVSKLISIETKVAEEESKRQLAEIALKTSKLDAQKRKVDADAKRYELQQADGLSEEMKYRIDADVRERVEVAKALAGPEGIAFPKTYIAGGDSKGGNQGDLMNLLLLQMLEGNNQK